MERNDPLRPVHARPTSRRTFLARMAGVTIGLPLLAACGPTAPSVAPTAKPPRTDNRASGGGDDRAQAGCGRHDGSRACRATTAPKPAAGQPKMGGTLRVGVVGEYVNIDGHYYSTKAGLSHWMIYDTLTRYDDDLKVQPMLAESWEHEQRRPPAQAEPAQGRHLPQRPRAHQRRRPLQLRAR